MLLGGTHARRCGLRRFSSERTCEGLRAPADRGMKTWSGAQRFCSLAGRCFERGRIRQRPVALGTEAVAGRTLLKFSGLPESRPAVRAGSCCRPGCASASSSHHSNLCFEFARRARRATARLGGRQRHVPPLRGRVPAARECFPLCFRCVFRCVSRIWPDWTGHRAGPWVAHRSTSCPAGYGMTISGCSIPRPTECPANYGMTIPACDIMGNSSVCVDTSLL